MNIHMSFMRETAFYNMSSFWGGGGGDGEEKLNSFRRYRVIRIIEFLTIRNFDRELL